MSIGLGGNSAEPHLIRDVDSDYVKAYLADYERFASLGRDDLLEAIARELRILGHEVKPKATKAPAKEKAVAPEPLETAVENDEPAKRGRPRKTAE
jgi:hypothetical protein